MPNKIERQIIRDEQITEILRIVKLLADKAGVDKKEKK